MKDFVFSEHWYLIFSHLWLNYFYGWLSLWSHHKILKKKPYLDAWNFHPSRLGYAFLIHKKNSLEIWTFGYFGGQFRVSFRASFRFGWGAIFRVWKAERGLGFGCLCPSSLWKALCISAAIADDAPTWVRACVRLRSLSRWWRHWERVGTRTWWGEWGDMVGLRCTTSVACGQLRIRTEALSPRTRRRSLRK